MYKILVIEDNCLFAFSLQRYLKELNYSVDVASNGDEGIQKYNEEPADLIITDIFMPGKDGLLIIKELKEDNPECKIIAMTGGGTVNFDSSFKDSILEAAKNNGALHAFKKPFDFSDLGDILSNILPMNSENGAFLK